MSTQSGSRPAARSVRLQLPVTPFFYTVDQVAYLLNISEAQLRNRYIYFVGRSPGTRKLDHIEAINIEPDIQEKPDWRISEKELLRWCKRRGYSIERKT